MNVFIVPSAEKEFFEVINFYEDQLQGLGNLFTEEFLKALDFIQLFPTGWQKVGPHTRKYLLKKFPYIILYVAEDARIVITAIAHQHRHPNSYLRN